MNHPASASNKRLPLEVRDPTNPKNITVTFPNRTAGYISASGRLYSCSYNRDGGTASLPLNTDLAE
jgi:hypothetical protein